jgi:phage-related protein
MNVGELVATLDINDKGYSRGLVTATAEARTAAKLIERNLDEADGAAVGTRTGAEVVGALQATLGAARPALGAAGERAGEAVGDGITRGADGRLRDARGKFVKSGEDAGGGFETGVLGAFRKALPGIGGGGGGLGSAGAGGVMKGLAPLLGNVFVLVGVAALALWALPAIGATVGVALALGFGGAIAGVGFAAAAQAERVQDAFSDLKDNVVRDLRSMAVPLEQTLVDVAGDLQSLFDSLSPHLEDAFAEMAPVLSEFSDLLFGAFEGAGPVIDDATEAFNALLGALGPDLEDSLGEIWDALSGLFGTISENPEPFAGIITGALGLVAKLIILIDWLSQAYVWINGNIPGGILGLLSPLGMLTTAFGDAATESGGFRDAMMEMGLALLTAWGFIKGGAEDLWEALQPILDDLWEALASSDVLATVQEWWSQLSEIFALGGELIGTILSLAAQALTFIWENWGGDIIAFLGGLWTILSGMVTGGLEVIEGIIETILGVITGDWERAWEGIKKIGHGIWTALKGIVLGAIETISAGLSATLRGIQLWWNKVWGDIKSAASSVWSNIKSTVSGGIESVKSRVSSGMASIRSGIASAWSAVKTATSNAWSALKAAVANGIKGAMTTVRNTIASWRGIGRDIVQGIINGVTGKASALYSSLRNLASNALSSAKNALGISSPSRVMRDQVGRWIPEGIAAGLDLGQRRLNRKVRRMADDLTLSLSDPPPGAGAAPRRPGAEGLAERDRGAAVYIEHFHVKEKMSPHEVGETLYGLVSARR